MFFQIQVASAVKRLQSDLVPSSQAVTDHLFFLNENKSPHYSINAKCQAWKMLHQFQFLSLWCAPTGTEPSLPACKVDAIGPLNMCWFDVRTGHFVIVSF